MTSTRLTTRMLSVWLVCVLFATQLAAQPEPQLPNPGNPPISREQQIQLGFKAASQVYQQMPVLPDNSPETQYVRRVGQRLASVIPPEYSWPFEFHTIAEKDVNAFALPGGPMFVNLGAITTAGSEAELAGVMAHEMAHVYMQHSAKQIRQNTGPSIVAGLGQILGSMIGGIGGAAASIGGQLAGGMWSMKYSRADESQADAVGAMIMYRAGYDPRALARFFERLEQEGGSRGPQFLSDHPNPGNRQEAILNEADRWPPKQWRTNPAEFTRIQQLARQEKTYSAQEIADGAKSGRWAELNRRNGAVFNAPPGVNVQPTSDQGPTSQNGPQEGGPVSYRDVAPSSRFVNTDLGSMSIARPENWEVFGGQQQGQGITIAPRAGVAGNGIGYGVVINSAQPQNSSDIDQITDNIVRSLQNGGGDLHPIGDPQPITVNGARGRSVMMQSTSPFPTSNGKAQRERDWLLTLPQRDGSVVFLVFVSPASEFEQLRPTFNEMLRSTRF
ncbi:MAG: M48 family metalloprotease [Terriglobales bacterium]